MYFVNPFFGTKPLNLKELADFTSVDTAKAPVDTAKYPYRLGHIADRKGDLGKRWYVKFHVWDLGTGKLKPIQNYGDPKLNSYPSYHSRMAAARRLKTQIDSLLKAGYVINSSMDEKQFAKNAKRDQEKQQMTISRAFDYALKIKKAEVSKVTYQAYTQVRDQFKEYLINHGLFKVPASMFSHQIANQYFNWLKTLGLTAKTINNRRSYFRVFVNVLKRERILLFDPTEEVPKLKVKSTYHETYTDEEATIIREYLQEHDPHLWLLCQFVYYCFVRSKKEARLLKVKHVRANNVLTITDEVSKTDIRFPVIPVPLQEALKKWNLAQYPGEYYLFAQGGKPGPDTCYVNYWTNKYYKVREALGINKEKTLYSWKHTGACKLFIATKDPNKVKDQAGHRSMETTLVYLRNLGMFDNKEVENLFPEVGKKETSFTGK